MRRRTDEWWWSEVNLSLEFLSKWVVMCGDFFVGD
jgi:hypothetical protein